MLSAQEISTLRSPDMWRVNRMTPGLGLLAKYRLSLTFERRLTPVLASDRPNRDLRMVDADGAHQSGGIGVSDVALIVRIYLREQIGWEIFVGVFRGALLGCLPCLESGARNRADDAVAETLFSCSDNAKSCFMISAFCDLLAFLG